MYYVRIKLRVLKRKCEKHLVGKLHNEVLHNLYSSNVIKFIKIKENQPEKLFVIHGLEEKFLPNLTGKCEGKKTIVRLRRNGRVLK
jgi:hypothetical protein